MPNIFITMATFIGVWLIVATGVAANQQCVDVGAAAATVAAVEK